VEAGSGGPAVAENVATEALAAWYEAWNEQDVDTISALTTDDVRYKDPSAPVAVMQGPARVEECVGAGFARIPEQHLEKLEEWSHPAAPRSGAGFVSPERLARRSPRLGCRHSPYRSSD
jgi:hypothetical protein